MSPAINEELLVLAMCAYGGLVLMVCYDAIRIFRRVFRASIIRVIVEDVIFWTVAALFIFQIFFKYNYGRPRYYGVIAVLGTKHKRRKNSHTNKNTKNKKTDKRQKELTYKKSKSQKKTGQRLKV